MAIDSNRAGRRGFEEIDQTQERGFAGTAEANNPKDFAAVHVNVAGLDGLDDAIVGGERLREVSQLNHNETLPVVRFHAEDVPFALASVREVRPRSVVGERMQELWLDHVGVVGHDLDHLAKMHTELGFTVTPESELVELHHDGSTKPLGQLSRHVLVGNGYLELTAVDPSVTGHHLGDRVARPGMHIVVWRTAEAAATAEDLGVGSAALSVAARQVDYSDRSGVAQFRWAGIPEDMMPEAFGAFVEHLTPDLVLPPLTEGHDNLVQGIDRIVLAVEDPDATIRAWDDIHPDLLAGVRAGSPTVAFMTGDAMESTYGVTPPELPWPGIIVWRTSNLAAIDAVLHTYDVDHDIVEGAIVTAPGDIGVAYSFIGDTA